MSTNLKIVSEISSADVKLERITGDARKIDGKPIVMKDDGSPKLKYKDPTGKVDVQYQEMDTNGNLINGRTSCYVDINGNQYQKSEIQPFYQVQDSDELIPATKNEKTEVFKITAWEPVVNYLDRYQMDAYYQVYPSAGTSKKDIAKLMAIEANTTELKKLWDFMDSKGVVGRATLNLTSAGYLPSVGYLRAVRLGTQWTFEIARFKENKPFTWSESIDWQPQPRIQVKTATTKAKAVIEEI